MNIYKRSLTGPEIRASLAGKSTVQLAGCRRFCDLLPGDPLQLIVAARATVGNAWSNAFC